MVVFNGDLEIFILIFIFTLSFKNRLGLPTDPESRKARQHADPLPTGSELVLLSLG